MDCEKCIHENRISALEKDIEKNSSQHREFYNRLEEVNVRLGISDSNYANLISVVNEIRNDVKEIKEKPAKKWDTVSLCIVTAVISGVVGYLVSLAFV